MIDDRIKALMQDEEISRLTKAAASSFRYSLTEDEIKNAVQNLERSLN